MLKLNKNFFKFSFLILILYYLNNELCSAAVFNKHLKVEDRQYWHEYGMKYLKKRLDILDDTRAMKKAKNIIIFLGDGMGLPSITAGRIYKGQLQNNTGEDSSLSFDNFPNIGLAKTYTTDKQVPDSAATATAIFSGIKTRFLAIGMDNSTSPTDSETGKLESMLKWAQDIGKRTGIVTTTRITHATPAAAYASVFSRDWECDAKIPESSRGIYKDIARQLVEEKPGIDFNVIFGGGLTEMGNTNRIETFNYFFDGPVETSCTRTDGKNLVKDWLNLPGDNRKFIKTKEELLNLNIKNVSHVLGLFRNNHLTYALSRQPDEPTIGEMVKQAISILSASDNGYVLMVEGGRIDQAHHQNYAHAALQEVVELDEAIEIALNMTSKDDTLIIVTADHSHSMTFNGYPDRGNDILGYTNDSYTPFPYETISYANGPGFYNHRANFLTSYINTTQDTRYDTWIPVEKIDPEERAKPTYRNMAAMPLTEESHGGEDVPVYAIGPGSQLIGGVFEQNYIAYVMSYVGCMGPARDLDESCTEKLIVEPEQINSGSNNLVIANNVLLSILLLFFFNMFN